MLMSRWIFALPWLLASAAAPALEAASIKDGAGMFSPDATRDALDHLKRIEREHDLPVTIETIDSLDGQPLDAVTRDLAKRSGTEGIFILIPKSDNKIEVISSKVFDRSITRPRRLAIRDAFIEPFKKRDFDAGLTAGVRAIDRNVAEAKAEVGSLRGAPAPGRARNPVANRRAPAPVGMPGAGGGMPSWLPIVLLLVGGFFLL